MTESLTRRGFIGSILALGAAPAIVRADSLMRIRAASYEIGYAWRTRPADIVKGPFVDFTNGMTLDGLLVSDIIPGAARMVTFTASGILQIEFNPGVIPPEHGGRYFQSEKSPMLLSLETGPNALNLRELIEKSS